MTVQGTPHAIRAIRYPSFSEWISKCKDRDRSSRPLVGWELAPFVPLGPDATMPKRNALDHLEHLIYLCRCWVRQITPKGKGEKVHNLNLSCRIKVRFKSGRIIKRFRASVFFQREE